MTKLKSAVIYKGPSLLDGAPIIVIATGLGASSANRKTGDMIQTWILRDDIAPHIAIKSGQDESICGNCPHRGTAKGDRTEGRSCYVTVHNAPLSTWKAYKRGNIDELAANSEEVRQAVKGRLVRLGAYGDPAAVPSEVWEQLIVGAAGHTGYTHQWDTMKDPEAIKRLCMASADNTNELRKAQLQGWRTFRVRSADSVLQKNEVVCPASEEAGKKLNCDTCLACNGANGRRSSIAIMAHGSAAKQALKFVA